MLVANEALTWRMTMARRDVWLGLLHGERWVWSNGQMIISRGKPKKQSEKQIWCHFVHHKSFQLAIQYYNNNLCELRMPNFKITLCLYHVVCSKLTTNLSQTFSYIFTILNLFSLLNNKRTFYILHGLWYQFHIIMVIPGEMMPL